MKDSPPMSPAEAFSKVYGEGFANQPQALTQAFYEVFVAGWNACNKATIARWEMDISDNFEFQT